MGNTAVTRNVMGIGVFVFLAATGSFGLVTSIWDFDLSVGWNTSNRINCSHNLRVFWFDLNFYIYDSPGEVYPPLSDTGGTFMFTQAEMGDEIFENSGRSSYEESTLICPAPIWDTPETHFSDRYYVYTGYLLRNDEDMEAFAGAYTEQIAAGGDFTENLVGDTSYGDEVLRLREGIHRFFITDINNPAAGQEGEAVIPIMWEWPDNHQTGWGGNVLYMDGHVEWVPYPGKFPMTEAAFTTLAALAEYTPPTAWNVSSTRDYPIYQPESGRLIYEARNRLRELGQDIRYSGFLTGDHFFPQLSNEPHRLMMRADELYPEFTTDREATNSPGVPQADPPPFFDDQDYVYLGYYLPTEEDIQAFAMAYAEEIAAGGDFSGDLDHPSSYGDKFIRLRDDIQELLITDYDDPGQAHLYMSQIPALIEWPDNYKGLSGGYVIYMDGSVAWLDYPSVFPMTETAISTLRALAQVPEKTEWLVYNQDQAYPEETYAAVSLCAWNLYELYYPLRSTYPLLSGEPGHLMFTDAVYPDDIQDPRWLVCPGTGIDLPALFFDDDHYFYPGYALLTDTDVQNYAAAYADKLASGGDFSGDLDAPSSYGSQILRLRQNVTEAFNAPPGTPLQELYTEWDVPLLIEWPGNHEGRTGGHVLYMDGRREWIDYPGKFPMTEASISAFAALADWSPIGAWPPGINYDGFGDTEGHNACAVNADVIGLALRNFSRLDEGGAYFPKLSCAPDNLMFDDEQFLTYHLKELRRTNCPSSAAAYHHPSASDHSYVYLGYAVFNQETLEQFAAAYSAELAAGGEFTEDLPSGEDIVFRLRENVEQEFVSDVLDPLPPIFSDRDIPIFFEWPDNHGKLRGGYVVYLDGSRKWLEYPGKFPMTEEAMTILTDLAGREPIRAPVTPPATTRLDSLLSP